MHGRTAVTAVTARGLSPNQLAAELAEHGGYEEAIAAHPELADRLEASRQATRLVSDWAQMFRKLTDSFRPLAGPLPEPEPFPDVSEYEIGIIAAGVSAALEQHGEPPKLIPGVKETKVPKATKMKAAELRIAGETVAEIRRQTKLSKTVATRLVREIDAVLAGLRAGRY